MFKINWPRGGAERYHRPLPEEVRSYLKGRGIPSTFIEEKLLGWDGTRIVIPIFGRKRGEVLGFRYAEVPEDHSESPKMFSDRGARPELYGLETLREKRLPRVVVCEGELDRLVLEANGFHAVTSTAGAGTFLPEWVPYFADVKHVYICFDRNAASQAAGAKMKALLPAAHTVTLPSDVSEKSSITDYFARLGYTPVDFEVLLANAAASDEDEKDAEPPVQVRLTRPLEKKLLERARHVKKAVRLYEVVSQFATLRADGGRLISHCLFHDDRTQSFTVYPKSDTYYCFGCEVSGDVISFLMDKESMSLSQALDALEGFEFIHELYATGS